MLRLVHENASVTAAGTDRCAVEPASSSLSDANGISHGPQAKNGNQCETLDRLNEENVELRNKAIDLALQIQSLQDAMGGRVPS